MLTTSLSRLSLLSPACPSGFATGHAIPASVERQPFCPSSCSDRESYLSLSSRPCRGPDTGLNLEKLRPDFTLLIFTAHLRFNFLWRYDKDFEVSSDKNLRSITTPTAIPRPSKSTSNWPTIQ